MPLAAPGTLIFTTVPCPARYAAAVDAAYAVSALPGLLPGAVADVVEAVPSNSAHDA